METRAHYGKAALSEGGNVFARIPLTEIVDDLAELKMDEALIEYLTEKYGRMAWRLRPNVITWVGDYPDTTPVTEVFRRAARVAAEDARGRGGGKLDPGLQEYLARVRYRPEGHAEIDRGELPTLGAWALAELVRSQRLIMQKCSRCQRPFLSARDSGLTACNRPAWESGRWPRTCRQLERERLVDTARREYRREYRNIWDRVNVRETVPEKVFELWQEDFSSLNVQPRTLDEWINLGGTENARLAAQLMDAHRAEHLERLRLASERRKRGST